MAGARTGGGVMVSDFEYRANIWGQLLPCRLDDWHLPHLSVTWYLAGMWEGGTVAVLPGESAEQAAVRAYGTKARVTPLYTKPVRWAK